jgi:hypothetical protein
MIRIVLPATGLSDFMADAHNSLGLDGAHAVQWRLKPQTIRFLVRNTFKPAVRRSFVVPAEPDPTSLVPRL